MSEKKPQADSTIDEALRSSLSRAIASPDRQIVAPVIDPDAPGYEEVQKAASGVDKARGPWLTYYFAVSPGVLRKHFSDGSADVLISFANFVRRGKLSHKVVPWDEIRTLKKAGRRVMLDSGAFTNFNKPDHVKFEQYLEFLATPETKELFDEYVMFDELRDREKTLQNYVKMLEEGHDPLFVDHLWHPDSDPVLDIWKSREKLCLSGFATTLPTQERFPGDPKARLADAMLRGRDVDTQTHLLAVSSLKRFLKYADRVDSVDSTAWAKAGVYSMHLHTVWVELNGITVPMQKVWDRPGSGRKKPRFAPPKEAKKAARRVRQLMRLHKCNERQAYTWYSIEQAKVYAAGLNALDPKKVAEAYSATKVKKGVDPLVAERGRGFAFISEAWSDRDSGVEIEKAEVPAPSFDPRTYSPASRGDEALVSDWTAIGGLFAAHKQHEGSTGLREVELVAIATAVAKEISRRGPRLHVFQIDKMDPARRELWGTVLRHFTPPEEMVSKVVATPRTRFEELDPRDLLKLHDDLHDVGHRVILSRSSSDWTLEELVDAHAKIVEALASHGYAHPASPGALDTASKSFEDPRLELAKAELLPPATELAKHIIRVEETDEGISVLFGRADGVDRAIATAEKAIDYSVPKGVKEELARGLEWHEEGHSGDGLLPETVAWARRMVNGADISPEKARKMRAWLARHEADKAGEGFTPDEKGFPSPGRVAWALWGGDPAVAWSSKLVRQIEAEEAKKGDVEKAISSRDGGKLNSAQGRYVSHLSYSGNNPTIILRFEKAAGEGPLETWAFPRPALRESVTSLAKADELLREGRAPLLTPGAIAYVERRADSPRGWLQAQGITPPGSYGALKGLPGVFQILEQGACDATLGENGERILKLTPDGGETRILTLRSVPCARDTLEADLVRDLIAKDFSSSELGALVSRLAPAEAGLETWVGRFLLPVGDLHKAERRRFKPGSRADQANQSKPAKPGERRRGSSRNKPGTATASGASDIKLSDATKKALANKAKEHNEKHGDKKGKRVTAATLAAVYRRGAGAFSTSHRPGVNRATWAMARVNHFLKLVRTGRPTDSRYITDNDLLPKGHPRSTKKGELAKTSFDPSESPFESPLPRLLLKAESEKRLVTGIVLQPEVVDAQNDIISADEIESAAHAFLKDYNKRNELGLMHKVFGDLGVALVESYIAPAPLALGGRQVRKGTWIMTVKVHDDELWGLVKKGKLTGFSIGGVASSSTT